MTSSIVQRIVDYGWRGVNTGGKHSGLLNAMYTAGLRAGFDERVAEVLAGPVITHPNLADSSSRMRPLVLAGKAAQARAANDIFQKERVVAGGVTQHTTARSTHGWVFADTAYMVPPSQAILGNWELAFADLKGYHRILAQADGLMRHVFNAGVPAQESYVDLDLWIDGTAWGRANGWWTAGVVDVLEVIPQASWDAELVAMYAKTAARLIECQDDGIWRATIDDSYALLDTSATVMIGYALAKGAQLGVGGAQLCARAEQASFAALGAGHAPSLRLEERDPARPAVRAHDRQRFQPQPAPPRPRQCLRPGLPGGAVRAERRRCARGRPGHPVAAHSLSEGPDLWISIFRKSRPRSWT